MELIDESLTGGFKSITKKFVPPKVIEEKVQVRLEKNKNRSLPGNLLRKIALLSCGKQNDLPTAYSTQALPILSWKTCKKISFS
jgi:hypothetical protein